MWLLLPQDVRRVYHHYRRAGASAGLGCIGIQTLLDHHLNHHHFGGVESDVPRRVQMLRQVLND
jgi:hypothetical protein